MERKPILSELKEECSFPEVFQIKETDRWGHPVYQRKIGHIRADYDGNKWWNTVWPCNKKLLTSQISKEIDWVYDQLISQEAFQDLTALRAFCKKHPEAAVGTSTDEYNFYYDGAYCTYWLRCITRSGDYNLYLHAFRKELKMGIIKTEVWEPVPEKSGCIRYVRQRKAMEVFRDLEDYLKQENLYPDEYFLLNEEYRKDSFFPQAKDIICYAQWGGSEGVYLEVELVVKSSTDKSYKRVNFATGKTLGETDADYDRMQYIAGCIYKALV